MEVPLMDNAASCSDMTCREGPSGLPKSPAGEATPMGLTVPAMAACVAGIGWMVWMAERCKSHKDAKRSGPPTVGDPEGSPPPARPAQFPPPPTHSLSRPDHEARAQSYQRDVAQLRRHLRSRSSSVQGETRTPEPSLKRHEEQLATLAAQLSSLRTEIEEVRCGWRVRTSG